MLLGTFHKQLAKFLSARHVETTRLKGNVRDNDSNGQTLISILEIADPSNDPARRYVVRQRIFYGQTKTGEIARVGTQ